MNAKSASGARRHGPMPHACRGSTLLGIFFGLLLGLACALGVVWYLNKTPLPFLDKTTPHAEKNETRPAGVDAPAQAAQQPQQLPGKPGDKIINEKPRFEFYKILPGAQEAAPGSAAGNTKAASAAATPSSPAQEPQPAPPAEVFYLQVGAFQKPADADNMKARLALMGLETGVQETNTPEKGLMYKVRVGPYVKPEEMNRVRTQLSQDGIQASVIKMKPAAQ